MSGFPLTKYGICPFGGNSNEASGSSADAVVAVPTVRGQTLYWYARLGRYACKQCVKRLDDDEKAMRAAEKHRDDEEFRSKAGFVTSVASSLPAAALAVGLLVLDDEGYVVRDDDGNAIVDDQGA